MESENSETDRILEANRDSSDSIHTQAKILSSSVITECNTDGNMESKPQGSDDNNINMVDLSQTRIGIEGSNTSSVLEPPAMNTDRNILQPEVVINEISDALENDEDVFYGKECINNECHKDHKQFLLAPQYVLMHYNVAKKEHKSQYVCVRCYDQALDYYEIGCATLLTRQPLKLNNFGSKRQEIVDIDSSDGEEDTSPNQTNGDFLSENDIDLIERELDSTVHGIFKKIDLRSQLTWAKRFSIERALKADILLQNSLEALERLSDIGKRMDQDLHTSKTNKIIDESPLEIYESDELPPSGDIIRPPIVIEGKYYAVKNKPIASWVPCKVVEQVESTHGGGFNIDNYKVRYLNTHNLIFKVVSAKHMAYFDPPENRLMMGERVIAYFDPSTLTRGKEKLVAQSAFYPGIIAEPMKQSNRYRYLIFYDDGYTQYVQHKDVRLVCHTSDKVWEDVHPASRDFIHKYVEQYTVNRPMVQCNKGQSMTAESNGTWINARVIDTDCSLVLMQFDNHRNRTEWIYRGSTRLGPVFKEYQKSIEKNEILKHCRLPRRTEPFIRYTKEMEASSSQVRQQPSARKRTHCSDSTLQSGATAPIRRLNHDMIYIDDFDNRSKGEVVCYTTKRNLPPKPYEPHKCYPGCLYKITHNLDAYSPLAKPLLSGWERIIYNFKMNQAIVYRSPCGRSMRNIEEVRQYLRLTENELNVENFDFSVELRCLAEYVMNTAIVQKRDISNGQEKIAVPLVNFYDNTLPPPCTYAAQRIPTEGVHLNLDEEFLVGCDCEDDCSDKSKCACWQLTIEGVKFCNPHKPIEEIGYQYKRLLEHVTTGIYECNSRCKCKSNCLNRVVQHSLEMKLQVFKTSNRGWGLRCINDIPQGAFICIYAGHLLTEAKANEGGADAGDEYFADLDYIEVAEQLKEGYESDVDHSEPDEADSSYIPEKDDDDEFRPTKYYSKRNKNKDRSQRSSNQSLLSEEESQERQVINFNPNVVMNETIRENSVRRLFGNDENPYIMDAKTTGNLGRYFNHSCNPNLFVQNVFVDTHDLRFPWVAFFAAELIKSGTELTWNYNYEVGAVPGKVLYCQCGAENCRLRLL